MAAVVGYPPRPVFLFLPLVEPPALSDAEPPAAVSSPFPATFALDWTGPPACPDGLWIRQRVADLLTGSPRGTGEASLRGEVRLAPEGYTLALESRYGDATHRFSLHATTCIDLAESVALIIAISLEPGLQGSSATTPPPPVDGVGVPAPASAAPAVADAERVPHSSASGRRVLPGHPPESPRLLRSTRARPPRVTLDVGMGFEWGWASVAMLTLPLRVSVNWRHWALEVRGLYGVPRRVTGEAHTALLHAGLAGLGGCFVPRARRWAFPLCAGVDAGGIEAWTREFTPAGHDRGPWMGPRGGAGVLVWGKSSSVAFRWDVELGVRLLWTTFSVDGVTLTETFPVSVRSHVGIVFALPQR